MLGTGLGALPPTTVTWATVAADLFNTQNTDRSFTSTTLGLGHTGAFVAGLLLPGDDVLCVPALGQQFDGGTAAMVLSPSGARRYVPIRQQHLEGAVLLSNGTALMLPHHADAGFVALFPNGGTHEWNGLPPELGHPAFEGGVVTVSGKVLLAPSSGPDFATFDPQTATLRRFIGPGAGSTLYKGAVLLADGETALLVPTNAGQAVLMSSTSVRPLTNVVSLHAGGVLLESGNVLLLPNNQNAPFVELPLDGGGPIVAVAPDGGNGGFFSATWATNGFAYGFSTDSSGAAKVVTISRHGGVEVSTQDAGFFLNSHFGLVARTDGILVACPYDSSSVVLISPAGKRVLSPEIMLSPWLNKW